MKPLFSILCSIFLLTSLSLHAQTVTLSHLRDYEEGLKYPTDICGSNDGNVFVLDAMNDRVLVLKLSGGVSSIKPARDSFYKAVGLTWANGKLWIADTPRSRVLHLEENGRIGQVIKLGHGVEPVDVTAVGSNLAVSDRKYHSITVVEANGDEKYHWGGRGNELGEFINPGFLATAPENRLIIGDILNRRVLSYSQSGRFPQLIAKPGVQEGQIFRPKGIALDSQNRIWIADGYTGALQLFSISGKFLGVAKDEKGETIQLSAPTGIWIDGDDRVWVVESYASKVSVWSSK